MTRAVNPRKTSRPTPKRPLGRLKSCARATLEPEALIFD